MYIPISAEEINALITYHPEASLQKNFMQMWIIDSTTKEREDLIMAVTGSKTPAPMTFDVKNQLEFSLTTCTNTLEIPDNIDSYEVFSVSIRAVIIEIAGKSFTMI